LIEEYPENPGLYFLSAISRLLQNPLEPNLALDELSYAINFLIDGYGDHVSEFIETTIRQVRFLIKDAELSDRVVGHILTSCFLKDPSSEMAIVIEQYDTELAEKCYLNLMLVNTRAFNKSIG